MGYLPFKDISYANGLYNMATNTDPIIAMKASGFYTGSLQPYLDTQLTRNYSSAIRMKKVPILYHFAGGADPTVEASYFISAASPLAAGDVYALDWEIEHTNPVAWVKTFVTHVHAVTGVWPLIYMDIDRLNRFDWSPVLVNCGLWLAAPSFGFDVVIPSVHNIYVAQQGPILNGIDTDAWFGTLEELKAYGYKVPKPQTPPTVAAPPTPMPVQQPVAAPVPVPAPPPTPNPQPITPTPATPPIVPGSVVMPGGKIIPPPVKPPTKWEAFLAWLRKFLT